MCLIYSKEVLIYAEAKTNRRSSFVICNGGNAKYFAVIDDFDCAKKSFAGVKTMHRLTEIIIDLALILIGVMTNIFLVLAVLVMLKILLQG